MKTIEITLCPPGYAWGYGCHGNYSNMCADDIKDDGRIPMGVDLQAVYEPEKKLSGHVLFNREKGVFKKATQTVFKKRKNFVENSC